MGGTGGMPILLSKPDYVTEYITSMQALADLGEKWLPSIAILSNLAVLLNKWVF